MVYIFYSYSLSVIFSFTLYIVYFRLTNACKHNIINISQLEYCMQKYQLSNKSGVECSIIIIIKSIIHSNQTSFYNQSTLRVIIIGEGIDVWILWTVWIQISRWVIHPIKVITVCFSLIWLVLALGMVILYPNKCDTVFTWMEIVLCKMIYIDRVYFTAFYTVLVCICIFFFSNVQISHVLIISFVFYEMCTFCVCMYMSM